MHIPEKRPKSEGDEAHEEDLEQGRSGWALFRVKYNIQPHPLNMYHGRLWVGLVAKVEVYYSCSLQLLCFCFRWNDGYLQPHPAPIGLVEGGGGGGGHMGSFPP